MAKKNKNKKQDSKTTFLGASAQQQENQIKLVTDAFLDFGTKINKDEALQAQIRLIEKDVKEKAEFERTAKKIAIAQEINEKQVVNTTENYSNTTKDNLNNVILQQSTNALEEYSSYQDKSIKEQREGIVVREKEFEQLKEYKLIKQISTEYVNTFLTKVQTEANEQKAAEKLALAEKVQTETLDQKNEEIKNLYTIADKMSQKTKYPNAKGVAESRKKTDMAFFGGSSFICAVSSVAAFFAAPYLLPYILTVLVLSGAGAVISAGVALNSYIKENNTTKINISPDSQDNSDASSKKEIIGENIKNEAKSIVNTIQTQVNNSTSINQKNNNPSHQNSRS